MAKIYIRNLRLRTIIGINSWERDHKQDVIINIEIDYDATKSSTSDNIEDTIDYKTLTKRIIHHVEHSAYFLLEKMGQQLLDIAIEHSLVSAVKITIDKPAALRFSDSVAVEIYDKK